MTEKNPLPSTDNTTAVAEPREYERPRLEPLHDYEIIREVEDILKTLAIEDREPTFSEIGVLRDMGLDTPARINHEKMRMVLTLELQETAGTATDRKAAREVAEAAEREVESQAPGLRAKIAELQKELDAVEGRARDARQRIAKMETAVANLRRQVPPWCLDAFATARRILNATDLNRERLDLEAEIRTDEAIVAGLSIENILLHCSRFPTGHPCKPRERASGGGLEVNRAAYDTYVREKREALPAKRERHAELQRLYDDTFREAEAMYLDIYAR